jgi:CRP-like cAMP-binding protein
MRRVQFQAGERMFSQWERSDTAYMVVVGAVEISAGQDGKAIDRSDQAGGLFGEMA